MQTRFSGILLCGLLLCSACSNKTEENAAADKFKNVKGTYFSLRQFLLDQFHTYHGAPYTFNKYTTTNGVRDSALENIYTVDWGYIFKTFLEADIGYKKFLGKYNFTQFGDDATHTVNFLYEAKDPSLFTQKLQVTADNTTNRIRSIYIETQKSSSFKEETQKLYYSPIKVIQIQQFEKSTGGKSESVMTEYRFM